MPRSMSFNIITDPDLIEAIKGYLRLHTEVKFFKSDENIEHWKEDITNSVTMFDEHTTNQAGIEFTVLIDEQYNTGIVYYIESHYEVKYLQFWCMDNMFDDAE